jgi:signal peptidase I
MENQDFTFQPKEASRQRLDSIEQYGMAWPPEPWEDDVVSWPAPPREESRWDEAKLLMREIVETVVLALLIFSLIRIVIQNFRIEGYSMEPNLHQGQYLIVNKAVYRWLHGPQRGDIVVFEYPRAPDRDFIKRVIGLPGETVEVRDGLIYVGGVPLDEPYLSEPTRGNMAPRTMGPAEYFVLGDNRNNSSDSRSWGPLPDENIIGKAWLSYWPPPLWGSIPEPNYSFASSR